MQTNKNTTKVGNKNKSKIKRQLNWKKYTKKPITFFIIGGFLLVFVLTIITIPKYNDFFEKKAELQKMLIEINGNPENNQFYGKKGESKKLEAQYAEKKKTVDRENANKQAILDKAFPATEQINYITDLLESYAIEHNSEQEPFELTSISFAKAKEPTVQKEETPIFTPVAFMEMQINLPLTLSEKNFEEFVKFIEKSGSLKQEDFYGKEKEVPLMTIESVNFAYTENPNQTNQQIINANFVLNTYINLLNK